MPNSYSSSPSVIPGNLTVAGNLTVQGSTFKLGTNLRKYRIQEVGNGLFNESVNNDTIAVAQDEPTQFSQSRQLSNQTPFNTFRYENIGTPGIHPQYAQFGSTICIITCDELKLGASSPYVHLVKNATAIPALTLNLGKDLATRDDVAKAAFALIQDAATPKLYQRLINAAGGVQDCALRIPFWTDFVQHSLTGNTTLNTVGSKTLRGNVMGANGGFVFRAWGYCNTVAGGGQSFFLVFGGTSFGPLFIPASLNTQFQIWIFITNNNATNAQNVFSHTNYAPSTVLAGTFTMAINTTLDQVLTFQQQANNAADTVTIEGYECELMNSFGPV